MMQLGDFVHFFENETSKNSQLGRIIGRLPGHIKVFHEQTEKWIRLKKDNISKCNGPDCYACKIQNEIDGIHSNNVEIESEGAVVENGHSAMQCEYPDCQQEVYLACGICLILLCGDHDDTPCFEHNALLYPQRERNLKRHNHGDQGLDGDSAIHQNKKRRTTNRTAKHSIDNQKDSKCLSQADKHPFMYRKCQHNKVLPRSKIFSCDQLDSDIVSNINSKYWNSTIQDRRNFIVSNVDCEEVDTSKNKRKYTFHLNKKIVCKQFFLNALGYSNDSCVRSVFENMKPGEYGLKSCAPVDKRGKLPNNKKFDDQFNQEIVDYIESFHPSVSHYKILHSPLRRYLPSNISKTYLYKLFVEQKESKNESICSQRHFERVFDKLNISFASSSLDKCHICEEHKHKDHTCNPESCLSYENHRKNALEAREKMKNDGKNNTDNNEVKVISVDMQKVIQLPKLEVKEAYFKRKLNVFNETFCDVHQNGQSVCIVWHEEESGRKSWNVASAYIKFIEEFCRDKAEIIFYCDNCGSQNKNKVLYSALISVVNSTKINAKQITVNYLEPGHTYMSADSCHASISKAIHRETSVYDFNDLVTLIENCRKNIKVIKMSHSDMRVYNSKDIAASQFKFSEIRSVQFRRGSINIFTANNHTEEFKEITFFKKSARKQFPKEYTPQGSKRGITAEKRTDLLFLSKLMPESRRFFYNNLVADENAVDLSEHFDIDF